MKISNNKNFFYVDVDAELVIRNLIFFVLFCIIIGTSINYFLWPMIEAYKEQHLEEKKIQVVFLQVQKEFNKNLELLKKTKSSNQKFLDVMAYEFGISRLKNGLSKYFKDVTVVKKSTQEDLQNQFEKDVYFVRGEIQDMQVLNNFFTDLQNAPMSIKVLLPITIKKSSNTDKLILEFYIDVEKSNYHSELEA
ncbi:hypothetical protein BKH41_08380 [Helicobacter sp. 12S02232-10]|uniref:hypothetical protein n=1 Tax=Helicobacter sp. 12S02232-10 TaxID=1476197 RepID=UPI000BA7682D|nr:hypothetical protein [Helicobacter sp. 12S02232-10]PAF46875.1 hypothetical protein BKH41_08380 [Helicobacter sp. 12S02232-10]